MEKNLFFGIQYPDNCNVDMEFKRELAGYLFASPTTTVGEVLDLVQNPLLVETSDKLVAQLKLEVDYFKNLSPSERYDMDLNLEETLTTKLKDWIESIGLPTEEEITIASNWLGIESDGVLTKTILQHEFLNEPFPEFAINYLLRYIIGQNQCVENVSLLLCDQLFRIRGAYDLAREVHLIIGPSGVGKTSIMLKASTLLNVPFLRIDCSQLVPSGIIGLNIAKALGRLFRQHKKNAHHSVVMLDEIDKLFTAKKVIEEFSGIQYELLNLLDDNRMVMNDSNDRWSEPIDMNISNLMLVMSGVFSGLGEVVMNRLINERFSFPVNPDTALRFVKTEDLIQWGMAPELVGRIGSISVMNTLDFQDFSRILRFSHDSAFQRHKRKCGLYQIDLQMADDAFEAIAHLCLNADIGVRNLNFILNKVMREVYLNIRNFQGKAFVITKQFIEQQLGISSIPFPSDLSNESAVSEYLSRHDQNMDDFLDLYNDTKNT
ncbi:MAG: AAA family ATPase [Bacteroidales bacterium]|nr:AAA family ATPase [Bacteroidales bacterium]